jgi:hypothetical protein
MDLPLKPIPWTRQGDGQTHRMRAGSGAWLVEPTEFYAL